MTKVKMGPKGQVVIPKAVREELDLRPGDEVVVDAVDGEARVRRPVEASSLLGLLADGGPSMMKDLEEEHRWEIEHDERRQAKLDSGQMW
ncbi:MAG: AbrB/MazE/SpoVT family DNA-binding domain-containing protein [Thermoleophilaceae bacterium]|jgi:AbrB family looped-hinge helix DNA binding protein|nr:AbrB/MazE/SpoVT family DNA-binding domain-containing protein [Thermoleophilaceae bacterium]